MNGHRTEHLGFTLIEVLVVITIVSLLTAIVVPSLHRARSMTKALLCKNNLRNLYLGQMMYTHDYNDWLASVERTRRLGGHWPFRATKGYRSPYDRRGLPETFGLNALFGELGYIDSDSKVWICPDLGMPWMAEYGCTYSFSAAGMLGQHKYSILSSRNPTSLLIWDNVTHYPPSPIGWYVERESRPMSTIPVNERIGPHQYLARRLTNQYGEETVDYGTFMIVTIDGWIGTNAENRQRIRGGRDE